MYDLPRTLNSHVSDISKETIDLIVQLRFGLGYSEDALARVICRDYGVIISYHGVSSVLKRAGILDKQKRLYPGFNPAYTVDFLEHATRFFEPAFKFTGIQTDNGTEFSYDHFPQVKLETKNAPERWIKAHGVVRLRVPPSPPQLNGMVERPHGVDKYRYKKLTTNNRDKNEL